MSASGAVDRCLDVSAQNTMSTLNVTVVAHSKNITAKIDNRRSRNETEGLKTTLGSDHNGPWQKIQP